MFLKGLNIDERKICISEKVVFLLHLQGLDYSHPPGVEGRQRGQEGAD